MPLTEAQRQIIRNLLLKKGANIARQLSEALSGRTKQSANFPPIHGIKPGMRPEEKLRLYLNLINQRRALLEKGDGRFETCQGCGAPLSFASLQDMPWATHCARCGG